MSDERDVVLVVGPSACGKTEALNILRRFADESEIPHVQKPLSDSHTIFEHINYHKIIRG